MKKTTKSQSLKFITSKDKVVAPLNSTLDFIRVFARIYEPKETKTSSLTEICVN